MIEQAILGNIAVGDGLYQADALSPLLGRKKMGKTPLRFQIILHGNPPADLLAAGDNAVLGLEQRKQPALDREPRQPDRVVGGRAPAERTRHMNMQIARAMNAHRLDYLVLEVVQIGDRGGGDIGDAVSDGDLGHALAGAENIARLRTHGRRRGGARRRRRRRGTLYAGVHIGFVIVADIEHVIVALEHAGQAAEADVGGAAIAALRNCAHLGPAFHAHGGGNAGRDRGGIAEQRMQPWSLPRGFRIGRGEHFQAAGGVNGDQIVVGGAHRGVDGVARAQRLAAALAGAVAAGERIGALGRGLHRALFLRNEPVADRESALLVEVQLLRRVHRYRAIVHRISPYSAAFSAAWLRRRSRFSAVGPERRTLRT